VLEKGYSVIYDSIINILRSIEREHFSREHSMDMINLVMDVDLLILDDLGTEYETAFYNSTVYNIINTRLNSGKPTIISTNLDFAGIRRRYEERVVSRITAVYTCMEFKGEDVRFQLKKQNQK
jgi:DNA replication protein DnaC